jgi:hypothetical protein
MGLSVSTIGRAQRAHPCVGLVRLGQRGSLGLLDSGGQGGGQIGESGLKHRADQRCAVGEMQIDALWGDVNPAGDRAQRERLFAVQFRKQFTGGADQILAQSCALAAYPDKNVPFAVVRGLAERVRAAPGSLMSSSSTPGRAPISARCA